MANPAIIHTTANRQKLIARVRNHWNKMATLEVHDDAAWEAWAAEGLRLSEEITADGATVAA